VDSKLILVPSRPKRLKAALAAAKAHPGQLGEVGGANGDVAPPGLIYVSHGDCLLGSQTDFEKAG
jgi:hypothetical protein